MAAADCERVYDEAEIRPSRRYLAFEPDQKGFGAGRVLTAPKPGGPWADYAGGVLEEGRLAYHRVEPFEADNDGPTPE